MKYLVCGLNDENYTMPDFHISDTINEAMKIAHDWCIESMGDDYIWCDIATECLEIFPYECRKTIKNEDIFYVTEIKPIKEDSEYVAMWHHAYNGVDFKVIAEGTKEECEKAIDDDIAQLINNLDIYDYKEGDMTIDTGEEWEHWELVKVK